MPATGQTWNQFKLLESLGKGGMGRVFLAEDTALDRRVALKFLPEALEEDDEARERFLKEAKAAAALDHPYICKIYEIGEVNGKAFIAMEYIEGETLHAKVLTGALPVPQILDMGIELSDALEAAHKRGVVHRDIKTPNIVVTPEGHVKILDFGVAKRVVMDALSETQIETFSGQQTSSSQTPGTVIYMSPEQVRGESVDGRTDIFSLGVVLYEMATGTLPFQGATSGLIYDAILNLGPRPPRVHNPQLPEDLERVILKAIEKDRDHRYQNAKDLMVDLKRLRRDTDAAANIPVAAKEPARNGRGGLTMALGAAALVLAFVVGVSLLGPGSSSPGRIDSLAVLPFENPRSDPELEYLGDGLAETLINRLSPLPQLEVMARSTTFRYRGRDLAPQDIGRELGVGAVLTGRVVQQGESLNVQAELVDVSNGTQIWGDQYERGLAEIVSVQNDLAREITEALRLELSGDESQGLAKSLTENSEAYRAYWQGRFHVNRRTAPDLERAITFFEQAKAEDPRFALADVGLADSHLLLGAFYGTPETHPSSVEMAKARTAARSALAIDPSLGEAHVTLAYIQFLHDWDWEAAESDFKRALELSPRYPPAHQWYSELLMVLGRHDEAVKEARAALALEPASGILSRELGMRLHRARRYDESIEQFKKTLELEPEFSMVHSMLVDVYWDAGMKDEALDEAKLLTDGKRRLFELLAEEKTEEAVSWIDSLPRAEYNATTLSYFYARAGARDQSLDWLERGFANRTPNLPIGLTQPVYDPWRSDGRFVELRRGMGLEP